MNASFKIVTVLGAPVYILMTGQVHTSDTAQGYVCTGNKFIYINLSNFTQQGALAWIHSNAIHCISDLLVNSVDHCQSPTATQQKVTP